MCCRRLKLLNHTFNCPEKRLVERGSSVVELVHGPEAKFSEIGTTQRDKGSYVFCDWSVYVDNEMR